MLTNLQEYAGNVKNLPFRIGLQVCPDARTNKPDTLEYTISGSSISNTNVNTFVATKAC